MPYSALAVANHFLDLADRDGYPMSQMKLIKLVYIAHGWHLAITTRSLVDEAAEAWKYGPVIPSLYQQFKYFGSKPITGRAAPMAHGLIIGEAYALPEDGGGKIARQLIDKVWAAYRGYNAIQLSALTHQNDSPWAKARHRMGRHEIIGYPILNEDIRDHYRARMAA